MNESLDLEVACADGPELDIVELGDAMKETKQWYPVPYTIDSQGAYGLPG